MHGVVLGLVKGESGIHPGFLSKSAQSIENKGREAGKKLQESSRVRKRLVRKEIVEIGKTECARRGVRLEGIGGETKVRRSFTTYDRTDCRNCQYIKWVLVFEDWTQKGCHERGVQLDSSVRARDLACG